MKIVSLVLISFVVVRVAFAERYLVAFKNQQIHHELIVRDNGFSKNQLQMQSYLNSQGLTLSVEKIESHLKAVNSLVVKDLTDHEAQELKDNRNVLYVEKEFKHPLPFPLGQFRKQVLDQGIYRFFDQETPWGIKAINSVLTWNITTGGRGARVLVLDTGVDRDHPSVRPNLEAAKDFVEDNQAGYAYRDTIGHGTHVAGTIAGVFDKSGFAGVAPKANILAGRVCAEDGCSNIAIVEGINWGVEQKVDVISMSLGGAYSSWAERLAIRNAYDSGIAIVAAAGNDGTEFVGYPAALPECIAVGAVDATMKRAEFSQFGPELAIVAPGVDVISSVPLGSGRESAVHFSQGAGAFQKVKSSMFQGSKTVTKPIIANMVWVGLGQESDFKNVDVAGKIALIQRGELKFAEKVDNAIKAKAAAVIIYNNVPGLFNGTLTEDGSEVEMSAYLVEQTTGEAWAKELKDGKAVRAQAVSLITNYASMSGTSMATPHVSGVVALMKAANPKLTPAQIKEILMVTAKKLPENDKNQTGAGVIQADYAVRAAVAMVRGSAGLNP